MEDVFEVYEGEYVILYRVGLLGRLKRFYEMSLSWVDKCDEENLMGSMAAGREALKWVHISMKVTGMYR